jgi:WD40 repeat protein
VEFNQSDGGSAAFAFSPDSHSLGIAYGNVVKILDVTSGRLRATLSGHELDIKSVDFSLNGRFIVTASIDNTARIWSSESGSLIHILKGHSASVLWAGFSPDGRKVLTVSNDHTARVWDVMTGQVLTQLRAERGLSSGRFSPDGQRILVLGSILYGRNYAALYEVEGRLLAEWRKKAVLAAEFDPDGKDVRIVAAEDDGKSLEVHDLIGGDALYALRADTELVGAVRFSRDRKHLLTAGFDHIPKVWNASTGELEGFFNIPPGKILFRGVLVFVIFRLMVKIF